MKGFLIGLTFLLVGGWMGDVYPDYKNLQISVGICGLIILGREVFISAGRLE